MGVNLTSIGSKKTSRRVFLKKGIHFLIGAIGFGGLVTHARRVISGEIGFPIHLLFLEAKRGGVSAQVETKYYSRLNGKKIRCRTCFRGCIVKPNARGFCLSRVNYHP